MHWEYKGDIQKEIAHIFESGANEIRVFNFVERLLERLAFENTKYRVKFRCYHYNTGMADNGHYYHVEEFDDTESAQAFKVKINSQIEHFRKVERKEISLSESDEIRKKHNFFSVEDGCIIGPAELFGFLPEKEFKLH